jgi:3-hydroxyisobutyrate dehydrogenase
MGSGMAGRILTAGFPLAVYNRNPEKTAPFAKAGAHIARTPRDAAARADIIISMLADDNASRAVWLDKETGALAATAPGTWLIESSTASIKWIHELTAAAKQHECGLLDAPVTGSKPQAASLAEAMALLNATGLDREKSVAILTTGAPGSPVLKLLTTRAAANDFTPNFILRLMAKDLTYAREEGARHGVAMNTTAPAIADFEKAIAAGFGEKDFSAIIPALQKT